MEWLLLAIFGGLGTVLRRGVGLLAIRLFGEALPFATLSVNLLGSFLLGFVFFLGADRDILDADARLIIGTGLMGGFTTYSSFNLETLLLVQQGAPGRAVFYVCVTLGACLVAGIVGMKVGQLLTA